MNRVTNIYGPAEQVHRVVSELIHSGNTPVLICEKPIIPTNSSVAASQNDSPKYAKQVINLGRKY